MKARAKRFEIPWKHDEGNKRPMLSSKCGIKKNRYKDTISAFALTSEEINRRKARTKRFGVKMEHMNEDSDRIEKLEFELSTTRTRAQTRDLLVMSDDSSQNVLLLEDKLRAKETQLQALETLKNESIQVKKELIRAQNSLELIASVRAEKETLARLIGALERDELTKKNRGAEK